MSDISSSVIPNNPKSVDDELYQKITDICFENGAVTKPMVDNLYALFAEKLEEAEIRLLRETAAGFQSVLKPGLAKGGQAAIDALIRMADHKERELATLTQDTKGGRDGD